jgi:5-methylcytosine-specific restriction protein B
MKQIADWHERILEEALKWRATHPDFRFNLRTGEVRDEQRLREGYWFTGNDRYLFFAPFSPNDPNNKTRSIGFVVEFKQSGEPKRSKIEIVFGGLRSDALKQLHRRIANKLGLIRNGNAEKYTRYYTELNPIEALHRFLESDYQDIVRIINESGQTESMLVPEAKFKEKLDSTLSIRANRSKRPLPDTASNSVAVTHDKPRTPINRILYGPPGTGKTYWMQRECAKYTDNATLAKPEAWLHEVMNRTGWRPVIAASLADINAPTSVPDLIRHRWIQAKAKERGRNIDSIQQTLWSYLGEHTPENDANVRVAIRREPFIFSKNERSRWQLLPEWRDVDVVSADLLDKLEAGPKPGSEPFKRYRMVTFHPSYSYEDFVRGIRPVTTGESETTQFKIVPGVFKQICDDARNNPSARYALFIDEINRANIAKVFGELITLIEQDKRAVFRDGRYITGATVQLPGGDGENQSEDEFGVPPNLDIFGTMNTADRSIALLDIALRRRFEFEEMEPRYDLLADPIEGVHLGELLRKINDRLEFLVDRDHRIGHAYFMKIQNIDDLRSSFKNQIIPLLQEYFFDDFSKVAKVLSYNGHKSEFVSKRALSHQVLFRNSDTDTEPERWSYSVTEMNLWNPRDFIAIYATESTEFDGSANSE